jgi:antitoxin component YwqK of YwqJK toxin-antitoxin module
MKKIMLALLGLLFLSSCGNGELPPTNDDGVLRSYWGNGKLKSEQRYVDGKLDGAYKTWYENGQVFQDGQYANGMMDGSWLIFYPDGQLASRAVYDKGTGKQTCYDNDGCIIMEVNYVDNLKHGKEIHYATDGTVVQIVEYDHGEKYLH